MMHYDPKLLIGSGAGLGALRESDPDRCRAALFAPKGQASALLTLYAFHAELAKVPEAVSEAMLGEIRYQWWRDAVAEIYEDRPVRRHEVATPLGALLRASDSPRFWIDRLIDGRARDIREGAFADIAAAEIYARETSGVLMLIAARMLTDAGDDEAVVTAGQAWGLTGLARGWGYHKDGMLAGLEFGALCDAAEQTYDRARKELGKSPAALMPAISYAGLVPGFLRRLRAKDHDPAQNLVSYSPLLKRFRLMRCVIKGQI